MSWIGAILRIETQNLSSAESTVDALGHVKSNKKLKDWFIYV